MTNAFSQSPSMRPVSVGYLVTLAFALVGIVFLAIGLGASLEARAGHDALDAINAADLPALFFTWFLLYFFRLIFWKKVPERRQAQARAFVTAVLLLAVAITVLAVVLLPAKGEFLAIWFTVLAALCQIATVTWLVRYRRE